MIGVRPLYSPNLRALLSGSGADSIGLPCFSNIIYDMAFNSKTNSRKIIYLGTASYDSMDGFKSQASYLSTMPSCEVIKVDLATTFEFTEEQRLDVTGKFNSCDAIIVSGGNTLYAIDIWKRLGIDKMIYECIDRGVVMTGGSAGAICQFDGGHSDSLDPSSFKAAKLKIVDQVGVDLTKMGLSEEEIHAIKNWEYVRINGLGVVSGLALPHADSTQTNGVLRMKDFDKMILRHPSERGVCIDHWMALLIDRGTYKVARAYLEEDPSKPMIGSLQKDAEDLKNKDGLEEAVDLNGNLLPKFYYTPNRNGIPGIWIKDVVDGKIKTRLLWPESGKLEDFLKVPQEIVEDPRLDFARKLNPF